MQSEIYKKLSTEKFSKDLLTKTEKKILSHLLEGSGNKEIARCLSRSVRTIEDHRANIMRKLGVENIVELIKAVGTIENICETKPAITMHLNRQNRQKLVKTTLY